MKKMLEASETLWHAASWVVDVHLLLVVAPLEASSWYQVASPAVKTI